MGLSSLTSQLEDVQAEMLPYTMATKPYYFRVEIVFVTVLVLYVSQTINQDQQVHPASDTSIQISH